MTSNATVSLSIKGTTRLHRGEPLTIEGHAAVKSDDCTRAEVELSLQQSLETIEDQKLKSALLKLGRTVIKRNSADPLVPGQSQSATK